MNASDSLELKTIGYIIDEKGWMYTSKNWANKKDGIYF